MAEKSYHEQERNKCTLELRELQNELPKFLRDYFRGIENSTAPRTQIGYAIDLRTFFEFVKDNNSIVTLVVYNVNKTCNTRVHKC